MRAKRPPNLAAYRDLLMRSSYVQRPAQRPAVAAYRDLLRDLLAEYIDPLRDLL
jgi:hypothetical protein